MPDHLQAAALVVAVATGACVVDPRQARGDFLVDSLVDDSHDLLLRDPGEVSLKWRRMTESPFLFFRGNLGLFIRDQLDPGSRPFDCDAEACAVLLVGDPHPENFGTFRAAGGVQLYDLNDFDAAGYGPFFYDVRRLALGFTVAMRQLVTDDFAQLAGVAVAEGYADAALEDARVVKPFENAPAIVVDLFGKARDEVAGAEWDAPFFDGEIIKTSPPAERAPDAEYLVAVDAASRQTLDAALEAWRASARIDAHVIDIARKLGSGVGSYSLLRYVALLDDGTEIELKEARDPLRVVGLSLLPRRPFDDNAERSMAAQRALQTRPDLDPRLGIAPALPLGFKVRSDTPWFKTQRVARIGKLLQKGAPFDDVLALARLDGALLFHAHARAPGPAGASVKDALTATVKARGPALVDDVRGYLRDAAPALELDVELLRERLDDDALLGWRP